MTAFPRLSRSYLAPDQVLAVDSRTRERLASLAAAAEERTLAAGLGVARSLRFGTFDRSDQERNQSFVIRRSFGGKGIVTWTDRDVLPADGLTSVFTKKQWEALSPPRLDSDD